MQQEEREERGREEILLPNAFAVFIHNRNLPPSIDPGRAGQRSTPGQGWPSWYQITAMRSSNDPLGTTSQQYGAQSIRWFSLALTGHYRPDSVLIFHIFNCTMTANSRTVPPRHRRPRSYLKRCWSLSSWRCKWYQLSWQLQTLPATSMAAPQPVH